jgi:hypothetical protein
MPLQFPGAVAFFQDPLVAFSALFTLAIDTLQQRTEVIRVRTMDQLLIAGIQYGNADTGQIKQILYNASKMFPIILDYHFYHL